MQSMAPRMQMSAPKMLMKKDEKRQSEAKESMISEDMQNKFDISLADHEDESEMDQEQELYNDSDILEAIKKVEVYVVLL